MCGMTYSALKVKNGWRVRDVRTSNEYFGQRDE